MNDLDIRASSTPAGVLESVHPTNGADYDLRPLALQYGIGCDGGDAPMAGAVYLDNLGISQNAQMTRMLPRDEWQVAANDILQDYLRRAKDLDEPTKKDLASCRDPRVTLHLWESNYLTLRPTQPTRPTYLPKNAPQLLEWAAFHRLLGAKNRHE